MAGHHGRVDEVLSRIIADHIRDPGLQELLSDPATVLEQFAEGPDGCDEAPLPPNTDWEHIQRKLKKGDVEIGVARAHEGGRN